MTKPKPSLNLIGPDGKIDDLRMDIYLVICDVLQARMGDQKLLFPVSRFGEIDATLGRAMDKVQAQVSLLEAGGVFVTERVIRDIVAEAFARMDAEDEKQARRDSAMPGGAQQVTGARV